MSEHPAGWYPDPRGRHEHRYWDGSVWTDHVADQGQASTDPVDVVGPAASSSESAATSGAGASSAAASSSSAAAESAEPVRESQPEPAVSSSSEAAAAGESSLWANDTSASDKPLSGDAPDPAVEREPARDPDAGAAAPDAGAAAGAEPEPTSGPAPVEGAATGGAVAGAWATPGASSGADLPGAGAPPAGGTPSPGGTGTTGATGPQGDDARSAPGTGGGARASDALRSATATKSPALAGLLTIVAPGSGHFYLGAGAKTGLAIGLLGATLAAYIIAWFSFTSFVIAFVIWAAAAAYGVFDLQGVLKPIREAGAAAASISPQQVGLVLGVGGVLLILGLLLPWYHVSLNVDIPKGLGISVPDSDSVSGFSVSSVIDLVLLVIGAATIGLGLVALGIGPVDSKQLPPWLPLAVAGAGAVAVVLVAFRLAVVPDAGDGSGVSIGRGPGILLDGAAALGILAAGLVALIQSGRGPSTSATPTA